MISYMRRLW